MSCVLGSAVASIASLGGGGRRWKGPKQRLEKLKKYFLMTVRDIGTPLHYDIHDTY